MSATRKLIRRRARKPRRGLATLNAEQLRALVKLCAGLQAGAPLEGQRILGAVIAEANARLQEAA